MDESEPVPKVERKVKKNGHVKKASVKPVVKDIAETNEVEDSVIGTIVTPMGKVPLSSLSHLPIEARVNEIMRKGCFEIDIRRALTNKFSMGSNS